VRLLLVLDPTSGKGLYPFLGSHEGAPETDVSNGLAQLFACAGNGEGALGATTDA